MNIHHPDVFRHLCHLALFFCIAFNLPAYAADPAGKVEAIKGTAWGQLPGETARKLEKGSPIYQSDILRTEMDSTIQLLFNDQTKFFLGADTEMIIYKFN